MKVTCMGIGDVKLRGYSLLGYFHYVSLHTPTKFFYRLLTTPFGLMRK